MAGDRKYFAPFLIPTPVNILIYQLIVKESEQHFSIISELNCHPREAGIARKWHQGETRFSLSFIDLDRRCVKEAEAPAGGDKHSPGRRLGRKRRDLEE